MWVWASAYVHNFWKKSIDKIQCRTSARNSRQVTFMRLECRGPLWRCSSRPARRTWGTGLKLLSSLFRPAGSVPELQGFLLTGLFLWRDREDTVTPCAPQSMGVEKLALPGLLSDWFQTVSGMCWAPLCRCQGLREALVGPSTVNCFLFPLRHQDIVYNQVLKKKGLLVLAFWSLLITSSCTFKMSFHLHFC